MRELEPVDGPLRSQLRSRGIRAEDVARGIGRVVLVEKFEGIMSAGQKTYVGAAAEQAVRIIQLVDAVGAVLKIEVAVEVQEFWIKEHAAEVHPESAADGLTWGSLLIAEIVDRGESVPGDIEAKGAAKVEILQGGLLRQAGDCEQ